MRLPMRLDTIIDASAKERAKTQMELNCPQCITYVFCKPMLDQLKKPVPENTGSRIIAVMDLRDKCSLFDQLIIDLANEAYDGKDPL